MKILIVTPLYPPDIAPLALYVKECATRLSTKAEVTVLAYAHLPEKIDGVRIVSVAKDTPAFIRMAFFAFALWREGRSVDVIYVQNGASVELPVRLTSLFVSTPYVLHVSDSVALESARENSLNKKILHAALRGAIHIIHGARIVLPFPFREKTTVVEVPHHRPEILPFRDYPEASFAEYEESWNEHIEKITHTFTYAKR